MFDRIEVSGNSPETREEKVGLKPFPGYYAGQPKLDQFVIRSFRDAKRMIDSFRSNELNSMVGLEALPDALKDEKTVTEYNVPLAGEVAVFMKTTTETFKDVRVRQAVVQSVDIPSVVASLSYPVASANSPMLRRQVGYDKTVPQLPKDIPTANRLLEEAGWAKGPDGLRYKNGKPLKFTLVAQNTTEYMRVSQKLQDQWRQVGISAEVLWQQSSDFQGILSRHDYDALLNAVSIGPDPDVFAYWHSSQADPRSANRLNFSEYKSAQADKALEAGRTRSDATIRSVKYKPFLEAWRNDAPALVLYQPRFLYVSRGKVHNFTPRTFNEAADRFSNASDWMVRQEKVPQS
jgi:peptide/nickel transport system substrate-binding protein